MQRSGGLIPALVMTASLFSPGALGTAQKLTVTGRADSPGQTGLQTGSHQTNGNVPTSASGSQPLGSAGFDTIPSPFPDNSRIKRNDERQRRLVNDTEKLVALTNLLKAEVASSGAETMSPVMLKQMEEIEKLAKSVKDKMRD